MGELRKFLTILKEMNLRKGDHIRDYKCLRCKNNKKAMKPSRNGIKNTEIICGYTKDKAVCEALRVKAGILVDGNDQRLRDLSFSEWYKVDHITASLFGFNTT